MANEIVGPDASTLEDAETCFTPDGAAALVQRALEVIEGRWKLPIIFRLFQSRRLRFSELDRHIPGLSQKVLAEQLKQLRNDGVIQRKADSEISNRVEYELTDAGRDLYGALKELQRWAQHHAQPFDPGL